MHHICYKVTNKLNDRYYIGIHSTENVDDGYLGSGKRIKAEVRKYGKENFERIILKTLPSRKALEDHEREIVNEQLLEDPQCLNLKIGGEGGGKFMSKEHQLKCSSAGGKVSGKIIGQIYGPQITAKAKMNGTLFTKGFQGKKHSEETKAKMRAARLRNLEKSRT